MHAPRASCFGPQFGNAKSAIWVSTTSVWQIRPRRVIEASQKIINDRWKLKIFDIFCWQMLNPILSSLADPRADFSLSALNVIYAPLKSLPPPYPDWRKTTRRDRPLLIWSRVSLSLSSSENARNRKGGHMYMNLGLGSHVIFGYGILYFSECKMQLCIVYVFATKRKPCLCFFLYCVPTLAFSSTIYFWHGRGRCALY